MTRYAVLAGPRSGRGRAAAHGDAVVEALRSAGQQATALAADTVDAARQVCADAVGAGVQVLVVVGGDGVVGLGAEACAGTGTALAIVPAGTGNDAARSLGVPLRAGAAIETLLRGTRRRLDVIEACDDHGGRSTVLGSVPMGLDALIAARAARLPKLLGPASYSLATLVEISRLRTMHDELTIDGRTSTVEAMVIAVCNLPIYGGGMRIAPHADPADGLLDVVVIAPVRAGQALGLLRGIFTGRHTEHPAVSVHRGAQVRVAGPDLMAYGDGEPVAALPLTCTVRPAALEVLVPRGPGPLP